MTTAALPDTDALSAVLRGNPRIVRRVRSYLQVHSRLTFSIITRYEILRGLKAGDILFAATALAEGYELVTNDERHFCRAMGLHVGNRLERSLRTRDAVNPVVDKLPSRREEGKRG